MHLLQKGGARYRQGYPNKDAYTNLVGFFAADALYHLHTFIDL